MKDIDDVESIFIKEGSTPGKTLAVFCGVHGNETAGIRAVKKVLDQVSIDAGKVFFVFANPRAIKKNVRFTEINLNRCFSQGHTGDTYEDHRATKLMEILDQCDALLDIHASNIPNSTPFVICEEDTFPFTEKINFPIISTGWDAIEPGATDGYMFRSGKIGICAECGYAGDGKERAGLAEDTIYQFLSFYGAIDTDIHFADIVQKHLHVDRAIIKSTESFKLTKAFEDFETLPSDYCYAKDGNQEYCVDEESVIVFANPDKEVGGEACILGYWV